MITFEITDMTCGHCVSTITKTITAADPLAKVSVDLSAHRVQIGPVAANAHELTEAIKEAGYTPVPVQAGSAGSTSPRQGGCCCS